MYPQLVQPDFRPGRDKQKMTSVGDIGWKVSGFGPVVKCKQVNRRIDVEFQFGSPSFIRQSCVSQVHVHSQVICIWFIQQQQVLHRYVSLIQNHSSGNDVV